MADLSRQVTSETLHARDGFDPTSTGERVALTQTVAAVRILGVFLTETVRISDSASVVRFPLEAALSDTVRLGRDLILELQEPDLQPLVVFLPDGEALRTQDPIQARRFPLSVSLSESLHVTDFGWGVIVDPPVLAYPVVELALGGSFRECVVSDAPLAWWRFAEMGAGAVGAAKVRDTSGFGHHGTIVGAVTVGADPGIPEGGASYLFAGGHVTIPATAPAGGATQTIECWFKPTAPMTRGIILADDAADTYLMFEGSAGSATLSMHFGGHHYASAILTPSVWHHIVVSITAGTGTFYFDGAAAGTFTGFTDLVVTKIGDRTALDIPLLGTLDELVIYDTALSSADALRHYAAGFWTDVSEDLIGSDGLEMAFGIGNNGPLDRMADAGTCTFGLWNDAGNSGGLEGYYSPQHPNARSGFTYGVFVRVRFLYLGTLYPRFIGKVTAIDPKPGRNAAHQVSVTAADVMADLIEADLRNVTLQIGQTEAALMQTVFDAMPAGAQPLALDLGVGLDVAPYAFDNLGDGMTAYDPLAKLTISSVGFGYAGPTGAYRYENRQQRQIVSSTFTFDDAALSDVVVPSTLENLYNDVRATFHPKTVDAAATTVLWSQTGVPPSIEPGASTETWGTYFNPTQTEQHIGGTAQVAVTATTDYLANAQADGLGTNKTANITVTAEPFASTVKFTITNNDAAAVFITKLQIRGKGLYDLSPQTVESFVAQPYGVRALTIDMPYQADYETALGLAQYIRAQYEHLDNQVRSFRFLGTLTHAAMRAAMTLGIGDRVTVSETVTGLDRADVFVQSISVRVTQGLMLECEVGVSPTSFFADAWIMDDADRSLAGTSTYFGYA